MCTLVVKGAIAIANVMTRRWKLNYCGVSAPLICCSGFVGEQIHRPSVVRALYPAASLCFVSVVTVVGNNWRWKKEVQSGNGDWNFLYFLFHPSHVNVFVHTHWRTARLCSAVFAEETGCNEVANRVVSASRQWCSLKWNAQLLHWRFDSPSKKTLIRVVCASRQNIANGKSLPLATVCVSFPPFFSVNICPSTRTYAHTYTRH